MLAKSGMYHVDDDPGDTRGDYGTLVAYEGKERERLDGRLCKQLQVKVRQAATKAVGTASPTTLELLWTRATVDTTHKPA